MRDNPWALLVGLFFALYLGAQAWRRRKLRRAMRDLPTRMQRLLGPEPDYLPPPADELPEGLHLYAKLHRRSLRIMQFVWALAFVWLAFVALLALRKYLS